jgi:membrane protein implicated in regulation of membrane protease activity
MDMFWIWTILFVLFGVIELITPQLVTIWFAIGALLTFAVSFFTDSIFIQIGVFIVSSILLLICTKPFVKKALKFAPIKTNVNANIGASGIVVESIDNIQNKGQVKVNGAIWSARSENDDVTIEKDAIIIVKEVNGVKLVVALK